MTAQILGVIWAFLIVTFIVRELGGLKFCTKAYLLSGIFPIGFGLLRSYYGSKGMTIDLPFPAFLTNPDLSSGMMYNIYYRNSSTFLDPTFYGCFVLSIFALLCVLFFYKIRIAGNRWVDGTIVMGAMGCCALAIVSTLSLSAIFGMVSLLPIMVLLNRSIRRKYKLLIGFIIILMVISITVKIEDRSILDIIGFKIFTQYEESGAYFGRYEYFENALKEIGRNPLFGTGYGGLTLEGITFSSAHNAFLTVLGQQGLFAFIVYVILLVYLPLRDLNRYRSDIRKLILLFFVPILALIISNIAYDVMFYLDSFYILFAMFIGASVKYETLMPGSWKPHRNGVDHNINGRRLAISVAREGSCTP